jgi:uncharacterized protein YjbJ (UPF0337 family)
MDKDRVAGAAHQVKGAVKETVGKVTGAPKPRPKGPRRKRQGKFKTLRAVPRMRSGTQRRTNCGASGGALCRRRFTI